MVRITVAGLVVKKGAVMVGVCKFRQARVLRVQGIPSR
jgi:hypothetical protein